MKINKTNDDNAVEPKTSAAGAQFLQIEPARVSDLDLLSVSGGSGTGGVKSSPL